MRRTGLERKEERVGWLFVLPAAIHLILFAGLPILFAFLLSLLDWQILREDLVQSSFVGLQNYSATMADGKFWGSMWNSTRYAIPSVVLSVVVALVVAVLVSQKLRGVALFRTLYYIPSISSGVAIAMLWTYVYLPKQGMINATLGAMGFPSDTNFLGHVGWAMWALVFMSIWTGLGPKMIIFVAGILGIPPSLYEAAQLDGAGSWTQFRNVTLPMLAPTSFFVIVTSTIGAFQVFTPIYMMTQGGPMDSTSVVGYHIYTEAWVRFDVGMASAKSFILLVVIAAVAYVQYRLMQRQLEGYSAE